MNNDVIGFKLADGSFYPVFTEGAAIEKHLELTTVRDDQTTIQLHLYKSPSGTMKDAEYVETLLLENLIPHPKEEPSLKLKIALDDEDNLSAEIIDPETGLSSSTNISLITLDEATLHEELSDDVTLSNDFDFSFDSSEPDDSFSFSDSAVENDTFDIDFSESDFDTTGLDDADHFRYEDIPDFGEIPENDGDTSITTDYDMGNPLAGSFPADDDFFEAEERRSQLRVRIPVIICIVCAVISVLVLAVILYLAPSRLKQETIEDPVPGVVTVTPVAEDLTKARENEIVVSPVPVIPEMPKKVDPVTVVEVVKPAEVTPEKQETGTSVTAVYPSSPVQTGQAVRYKLKWGDTLWDLAEAYYRNPWKYNKIARWNNIKNPDFIIAGTYIYIPE